MEGNPLKFIDHMGLLISYEAAKLPISPNAANLGLGGIQYLPVVWDMLPHGGVISMAPVPTDLGTVSGYQIVPYAFFDPQTGKPTSIAWYGAYDPVLKETIYAIFPDHLQDFIKGADQWRAAAPSLINAPDYQLSSSKYVLQILKGDFKGGVGTLACSWGQAFKSPEWWITAFGGIGVGGAGGLLIKGGIRKATVQVGTVVIPKLINKALVSVKKFSEYIFKEGATHGKDKVFRSLGYGKQNSAELAKIWEKQVAEKFSKGKFTLGKSDQYGQRVNIEIELQGIGNASGKTSYLKSGWMVQADGTIKLNTPFSGFTRK